MSKKQTFISFEGDQAKVLFVTRKKGAVVIDNTCLIQINALDRFLEEQRSLPNLHVIYPFRQFYSDILSVPAVKTKFLDTVVSIEIKKRFPLLRDFSFFYMPLTEKAVDEKAPLEIFFCAVENDEINAIVDRFSFKGKPVQCVLPDIVPLARLLAAHEKTDEKPVLGLLGRREEKTLFLLKSGRIHFVRIVASDSAGIADEDMDNINMTVSYCRQQLRLEPEKIVCIDGAAGSEGLPARAAIPIVRPDYLEGFGQPRVPRDFFIPYAAAVFFDTPVECNLLPHHHRTLFLQRLVFSYAATFFLIIAILGLAYTVFNLAEAVWYRGKIESIRKNMAGADTGMSAYEKASADLQRVSPMLNLLNEARSAPDMNEALLALSFLPMAQIDVRGIQVDNKEGRVRIQLTGVVFGDGYGARYQSFQRLLEKFRDDRRMTLGTKTLDHRTGQFQIEMEINRS